MSDADITMEVFARVVRERDAYLARLEEYDGQAWDDLKAERDAALAKLEQVRALHDRDGTHCTSAARWPCPTISAIKAQP